MSRRACITNEPVTGFVRMSRMWRTSEAARSCVAGQASCHPALHPAAWQSMLSTNITTTFTTINLRPTAAEPLRVIIVYNNQVHLQYAKPEIARLVFLLSYECTYAVDRRHSTSLTKLVSYILTKEKAKMLCEACSRMFSSGIDEGDLHASLASLTKAAADGCRICAPLLKDARRRTNNLEKSLTMEYEYCFYKLDGNSEPRYFRISRAVDRKGDKPHPRYFFLEPASLLPVHQGIYERRSAMPISESLHVARKWMSACLDEHEKCQKHTQPHIYPTRLLELGDDKAHLKISQNERLSGPYAALSYCWGPEPSFVRLTTDNLQDLQLGIPYLDLPIAFQEAIYVLKRLDIRYLWIDALCIIQSGLGSSEDWQSECGRMEEVYSNCLITLSLAQARHPNQTCIGGYSFESTLPFEADIVHAGHDHGPSETRHYTILPEDYFKDALYNQPLGSRAWVMQERLLATRVLSIGHGELFWDCQQLPHASESLPYGLTLYSKTQQEDFNHSLGLSIHAIPQALDGEDLEQIWAKLLMEYTTRELTYPRSDKLAALSAIANRMGHAMKDTYLAGHFWKTLPQSLNWRTCKGKPPYRLAKFSSQISDGNWVIIPSWSWASMHGRLNMHLTYQPIDDDHINIATAESYKLIPVSGNDIEERVENRISLTIRTWCRIIEWKALQVDPEKPPTWLEESGSRVNIEVDDPHDQADEGSECLLSGLSCLNGLIVGLLLREIKVDGNKVYERFGCFTLYSEDAIGPPETMKSWFTGGEQLIILC